MAKKTIALPTTPDPAVAKVWTIRGAAIALAYSSILTFPMVVPLIIILFDDGGGAMPGVAIAFGAIAVVLVITVLAVRGWARAAQRVYTFEIGQDEVIVHKGVIFRTTSHIPLRRVQDVHVRQGPLLRKYGLASVKLDTAGMGGLAGGAGPSRFIGAEGQIPGIRNAHEVADEIMRRVKKLKGDV